MKNVKKSLNLSWDKEIAELSSKACFWKTHTDPSGILMETSLRTSLRLDLYLKQTFFVSKASLWGHFPVNWVIRCSGGRQLRLMLLFWFLNESLESMILILGSSAWTGFPLASEIFKGIIAFMSGDMIAMTFDEVPTEIGIFDEPEKSSDEVRYEEKSREHSIQNYIT